MNKKIIIRTAIIASVLMMSVTAGLTTAVYAAPPAKPGNSSNSAKTINHVGEFEYDQSSSESDKTYDTTTGGKNTILVKSGTANFLKTTVSKTGDEDSGDDSDFYGTNAAILSINSSKIKITDSNITTNAKHGNAVFAYGDSTIEITDTSIHTSSSNSGALMVTGGGTLKATNVTAETDGNSSAPIRSDRGGGTMTISGGKYTSNGVGSPVIYSTANVTVKDKAELIATASEGVVIEGKNSVTLDGVSVGVTNTKLNGNSETYKSFFIYQSMSGDASEGTGNFTMKKSKVTNHNGDIFFVTNTTANISLSDNSITNEDENGVFLKATSGKWGKSGKNGGQVTLTSENEPLSGDIVVDNVSTLDASFKNRTSYKGTINGDNKAKNIRVTLDSNSRIILAGDSYISELSNEVSDNANIYANGHKLYVAGQEVTISQETPGEWIYDFEDINEEEATVSEENTENKNDKTLMYIMLALASVGFIAALFAVILIVKKGKNDKQDYIERKTMERVVKNNMKKPWEKA